MAQSAIYYETFNKYQLFMNISKICITVFSLKDKPLPQFLSLQLALLQIRNDFFYLQYENPHGKK